ncbi:MAG TPA: hypothetical protein VK904_00325 [Miltoncostaeaceae bacterium]|nr:hypothetical protein [Miltoncostaeaceae bacterium]
MLLGTDPAYGQVTVNLSGGGVSGPTAPGQLQLQVTPAGGAPVVQQGFCIDTLNPIGENVPYQASLQTAADDPELANPAHAEAAWLMLEADDLIAASPNPGLEAGAIQTAIWMILGEAGQANPTSDATLNARAQQVRALAVGKKAAGPVAVSAAGASTCPGTATTLTVTGSPGASASLAVTGGQGTLSASQVTFGADGSATVGLSSVAAGTVQVTVTSNGVELTRAARLPGSGSEPQETGFVVPRTSTASVSVAFTSCASPATVRPSGRSTASPSLKITKRAPKTLKSGSQVPYIITVRNTGKAIARNVIVSDRLPAGMSYLTSTRRPHQAGKRVVWRVGDLRPGQSRTMMIVLQAPVGLVGSRTNAVVATAAAARTVTAAATTRFTRVSQQRIPAVTG